MKKPIALRTVTPSLDLAPNRLLLPMKKVRSPSWGVSVIFPFPRLAVSPAAAAPPPPPPRAFPDRYSLTSWRLGTRGRSAQNSTPLSRALLSTTSNAFAQWLSSCASWMAFSVFLATLSLHMHTFSRTLSNMMRPCTSAGAFAANNSLAPP
jgi:hypothetical protein